MHTLRPPRAPFRADGRTQAGRARPVVGHKTLLGLGVLTLALLGAACGDDDGGDRLTTAEFETRANAICADASAEVDAAGAELFGVLGPTETPDPAELEAFIDDTLVPSSRDMLDEIRALEWPEDLEDEVDEIIEDTDSVVDELADMTGDEVLALFENGEDPFAEVNGRLNAIGLIECGDGVTEAG